MEKQMVSITICENLAQYSNIDSLIEALQNIKQNAAAGGFTNLWIDTRIESSGYYDDGDEKYAAMSVIGERLETDREYRQRIEREKAQRAASVARRRQQYLELKKEFEE